MKHIFLTLGLLISVLGFSQTTKLTCYNCEAIPKAYCAPCASGLTGTEYTSGIVVDRGPSNRVFIKKPFSWFVSGNTFTLTDYTGKSISFKATETIYGNVPAVVAELTDCNCPASSGGGGGPGSFNLVADVGEDSISGELSILTGTVLKSTLVGSTLTLDWDYTGASAQSVPYYNGTSTAWRTFATGIVDDPTVGGSDASALQTVLNNLNSGGGGSYTAANGLTLNSSAFELGGTLNRSTTIAMANNPFIVRNGTYNIGSVATTGTLFGVGTGIAPGGNGILVGDINSTTEREVFGYWNALLGVGLSSSDDDEGDGVIAEFFLDGDYAEIETYGQGTSSSHLHIQAPTSATVGGAELRATAPSTGETNYFKVAPSFIEMFHLVQYTSHATAWADRSNYQLYLLNDDATVYRKLTTGAFGTYDKTPQAITKYNVTISGGNSGSTLTIVSYGVGVTASFASNKLTIVIPTSVRILSADWLAVTADVQASADGGGVTNWVTVEFQGTGGNTSISNINIPAVQKFAVPSSGALSVSNAATADLDNNPAISAIAVGSGNITLRVGGLSIGSQGYHLKFSNI